jgi:hypothetical protein
MTKDEIIEMARKAGVRDDEHIFEFSQYKYLEVFVKLVAEKEREACATICEQHGFSDAANDLREMFARKAQEK